MIVGNDANQPVKKLDLIHVAILLAISLGIGVYLIATTVFIARDGVYYIEQAQKFSTDPLRVVKHPLAFGYPFLIFVTHGLSTFFTNSTSLAGWVCSAQCATLLCRLLSLIPLYAIGRLLVGSRHSFYAVLILIFLPYPAELGSDALRDWPYVLFLACGFWLILWAAKNRNCWILALAGLAAGLGYLIGPACAQLIVYGAVWLAYCLLRPTKTIPRRKTILAATLLIGGLVIPVGPYMKIKGEIVPARIIRLIRSRSTPAGTSEKNPQAYTGRYHALAVPRTGGGHWFIEAAHTLIDRSAENLMWFFVLPWLIGTYHHFQRKAALEDKILISVFVGLNITVLFFRYYLSPDLTRRYVLPLTAFTIFYIPTGLRVLSNWIVSTSQTGKSTTVVISDKSAKGFRMLLVISLCMCLPKLLRPIRTEKQSYLLAANWLRENTAQTDLIAVPDRRLSFYAQRKELIYGKTIPERARYVVKISKDNEQVASTEELPGAKKVFSAAGDDKKTCAIIYDLRGCISERVSFVDYHWQKITDEKYKFSFVFKVKLGFERNFTIYFHGLVKDENVVLLPENRQEYKFDNWDFYPTPPTSMWPRNEHITITRDISAKPIAYYITLGFYTKEEGRHGRQTSLGWVDLGGAQKSNIKTAELNENLQQEGK
jgi:hypothetical protein